MNLVFQFVGEKPNLFSFVAVLFLFIRDKTSWKQLELNDLMLGLVCEGSKHKLSLLLLNSL